MSADLENTNRSWSWRWVLGVVAAAAVAWLFLGPPRVVEQPKTPVPPAPPAHDESINLKSSLESVLAGVTASMQGIRDAASARLVASDRPALDGLFDKVLAIPGVDSIAKPAIDTLRVKLDALGKALPFRVRQETK